MGIRGGGGVVKPLRVRIRNRRRCCRREKGVGSLGAVSGTGGREGGRLCWSSLGWGSPNPGLDACRCNFLWVPLLLLLSSSSTSLPCHSPFFFLGGHTRVSRNKGSCRLAIGEFEYGRREDRADGPPLTTNCTHPSITQRTCRIWSLQLRLQALSRLRSGRSITAPRQQPPHARCAEATSTNASTRHAALLSPSPPNFRYHGLKATRCCRRYVTGEAVKPRLEHGHAMGAWPSALTQEAGTCKCCQPRGSAACLPLPMEPWEQGGSMGRQGAAAGSAFHHRLHTTPTPWHPRPIFRVSCKGGRDGGYGLAPEPLLPSCRLRGKQRTFSAGKHSGPCASQVPADDRGCPWLPARG